MKTKQSKKIQRLTAGKKKNVYLKKVNGGIKNDLCSKTLVYSLN